MPKQTEIPGAERQRDADIEKAIEQMLEHKEASKLHRDKAAECLLEARRLITAKRMKCYRYWDGDTAYLAMPISKDSLSVKKEKGTEATQAANDEVQPRGNGKAKKSQPKSKGKRKPKAAPEFEVQAL